MWNADFCENVTNLKPLGSRAGREKFDVDNVFVGIHKLFTTGKAWPAGAGAVSFPGSKVPRYFTIFRETFSGEISCRRSVARS